MYGRKWKKIEKYIGTRTSTQIRSHAQKYFIKLNKANTKAEFLPNEKQIIHPSEKPRPASQPSENQEVKNPFIVTNHKNSIAPKQSDIKNINKELSLIQENIEVLDLQIKEMYEKGFLLINMNFLLVKTTQLLNDLYLLGCKLISKKQIGNMLI